MVMDLIHHMCKARIKRAQPLDLSVKPADSLCWLCLIVNVYKNGKVLVKWLRISACHSTVLWNTSPTVVPLLYRTV